MKKTLAVLLVLCLALLCVSALAEGPKAVKDPYNDELKIGFIIDNIGHPVGNAWKVGVEDEAAAYPNITVQCFDGKSSAETEIQQMTDLINQGYDGILLQATDSAALFTKRMSDFFSAVIGVGTDMMKASAGSMSIEALSLPSLQTLAMKSARPSSSMRKMLQA